MEICLFKLAKCWHLPTCTVLRAVEEEEKLKTPLHFQASVLFSVE